MSKRQTQFARAFIPWIAEWSKMGLSGTQTRVLLLLASRMEQDEMGHWTAWFPREEMADTLGLSERTIRRTVRILVEKKAISRVGKAYNGIVQKYKIMPAYKGVPIMSPFKEGVPIMSPFKGERGAQSGRKGVPEKAIKGDTPGTPIRTLECASPSLDSGERKKEKQPADGKTDEEKTEQARAIRKQAQARMPPDVQEYLKKRGMWLD